MAQSAVSYTNSGASGSPEDNILPAARNDSPHGDEPEKLRPPSDEDAETGGETKPDAPPPRHPKWLLDMGRTTDWWSLWIGLTSFCLAFAIVYAVPYAAHSERARYVVPQPMGWDGNPLDAWDAYGAVGTPLLFVAFGLQYAAFLRASGRIAQQKTTAAAYAKGFCCLCAVATVAFWVGRNAWCSKNGLGYAVLSILFGMVIANAPGSRPAWLLAVAADGEFFIKCSLVLLAVEFGVIGRFGWQSFVVSWVGSPVALVAGYLIGTRLFGMNAKLSLLVSVGATWCGASAISAVGAIVNPPASDISVSISVVAAFTVIFTFAQAYLAIGVGMDDSVAGAWIGASVDQTGNVVASAAIISEEAAEVAGIVKMILNSGLGILATVVAFWWQMRPAATTDGAEKKPISLYLMWDKFPKFVVGYLLCSGVLTAVIPRIEGTAEGSAILRGIGTLNKWLFAIAFVGIGLGTNVKELWEGAVNSGVVKLYLVTNAIDIGIALGLAYAVF